MKEKNIQLRYEEYESEHELSSADLILLQKAKAGLDESYSPYSKFKVSAALRLSNGEIIQAANTENAAYPMCLCAERSALAAASSVYPEESVEAMAITVKTTKPIINPAAPCGACRQVLAEYEEKGKGPIRIILQGESGPIIAFKSASLLLPFGFSGDFLE